MLSLLLGKLRDDGMTDTTSQHIMLDEVANFIKSKDVRNNLYPRDPCLENLLSLRYSSSSMATTSTQARDHGDLSGCETG
jgi:hypothetical protein